MREHVTDRIQRQETFTISVVALKQTRGKDQLVLAIRKIPNPNYKNVCVAKVRLVFVDLQEITKNCT